MQALQNKCTTRQEALAQGQKRYFTGKPCKHGHIVERLAKSRICVACNNEKTKRVYHTNEKVREAAKLTSRKHHKKVGTKWYHENKQKAAEHNKQWRERHREEFASYCKQWRRDNLVKLSVNAGNYRASKLQATPKWADQQKILQIYEQAYQKTLDTGIIHAVDHIIPLNGEDVCGLHWEENLQVITRTDNSKKGNKHE